MAPAEHLDWVRDLADRSLSIDAHDLDRAVPAGAGVERAFAGR